MKNSIKYIAALLVSLFVIMAFVESDDSIFETLRRQFAAYNNQFRSQKIYLHTDRDNYSVNENLWIKAYLVSAENNLPDSATTNLYVEFLNPNNEVVMVKIVRMNNGFGNTDFSLSDTLTGGPYQIRAYTNLMQNFDEQFYFHKIIQIENPAKYDFPLRKHRKNFRKKDKKTVLQFFPEGGYLVAGIESVLAFKAENSFGQGVDFTGEIRDKNNKIIVEIASTHKGMGSCKLCPQAGMKYKAHIKTLNGKHLKFDLPEIQNYGYVLNINRLESQNINVKVKTNQRFANDAYTRKIYILAHSGGELCYLDSASFTDTLLNFNIKEDIFPEGVAHFTVFNGALKPLCERLAYIRKKNNIEIHHSIEKTDSNKYLLSIQFADLKDVTANFSISVFNKNSNENFGFENQNIQSSLFLTSDLTGKIEDAAWYFNEIDAEKNKALDVLMLTQGWRRFAWNNILTDNLPEPEFKEEDKICINGTIKGELIKTPLDNAKVTLTITNAYNDSQTLFTKSDGKFAFTGLDYNDTIDVLIEARNSGGRKAVLIEVEENDFRNRNFDVATAYQPEKYLMKKSRQYKSLPEEKINDDGRYRLHNDADNVIVFDGKRQYTNVFEALQGQVPGIETTGSGTDMSAQIRGKEPIYLIDGVPVEAETVSAMNPEDVDRIEILKSSQNKAIYGYRAQNGVIAIYTKQGEFSTRGYLHFQMLGFSVPREFYSPLCEENFDSDNALPDLILWKPTEICAHDSISKTTFCCPQNKTLIIDIQGITTSGKAFAKKIEFSTKK